MFLLDANIISEVRKGERAHPQVQRWWEGTDPADLFLSVLLLGEVRQGIEQVRPRNPQKAVALERWLSEVAQAFAGRILPIDGRVVDLWGRIQAARRRPVIDALLAATALANQLTLVTRNVADLGGCGARLLDPFAA